MEYHVTIPVPLDVVRKLRVNDVVYVTGKLFTARDKAHMKMQKMQPQDLPFDPSGMALYHCGPLMKQENGQWIALSAGPTTSARMEEFEDSILDRFGFHVIIGTLFLIVCAIRQYLGHLTKKHHVGFEAAAWYWHFVDVVRLFPFVSIYWWGGI